MPSLNEVKGSTNALQQQRGLLILQQAVKALASTRLRHDRRIKSNPFIIKQYIL